MPAIGALTDQMIGMENIGGCIGKITQDILYSDFTDSTGTTGTLTMTDVLPEGCFYIGMKVTVRTGFTGDTSCTLIAGKSSGADEFCDGSTMNIYTADVVGESAEDPLEFIASDASVYLVATGAADWTSVSAGDMTVELYFLRTIAP